MSAIMINGRSQVVDTAELSYEDVCTMVHGQRVDLSVTVRYPRSTRKGRMLTKGERAEVEDGMVINAVVTGAS